MYSQIDFCVKQGLDQSRKALSAGTRFVRKALNRGLWQAFGMPNQSLALVRPLTAIRLLTASSSPDRNRLDRETSAQEPWKLFAELPQSR